MTKPTVIPLEDAPEPSEASLDDLLAAIWSALGWLMIAPAIILHELAHAVAAEMLGSDFQGTGAYLIEKGHFGPIPVVRAGAFFVLHSQVENKVLNTLISLAPGAWLGFAWIAQQAGAPQLVVVLFFVTGLTVVSDVCALAYHAAGKEMKAEMGMEGRHVFLWGGPDQWQTTLRRYE